MEAYDMTTMTFFCGQLDDTTTDHACELDFAHTGACVCECASCLG